MWRLGGKKSDVDLGKGAAFSWQHDAKQQTPTTITVFDNGSDGPINTETRSRGIVLAAPARRSSAATRRWDY